MNQRADLGITEEAPEGKITDDALAAARALIDTERNAEEIVRRSLDIAAEICVFTNRNVTVETLKS